MSTNLLVSWIFWLHCFSTIFMLGVIWTIQIVHYPSFAFVDDAAFAKFSDFHQRAITYVVMPPMLVEIATAAALLGLATGSSQNALLLNLFLVILIWLSTFFLSMPGHKKLLNGKNLEVIKRLVATNWPRTLLWTARVGILFYLGVENFPRI